MRITHSFSAFIFVLMVTFSSFAAEIPEPTIEPKIVNPDPVPSDAIVLFNGKDLSQWRSINGGQANWEVKEGTMIVNGTGAIETAEGFGDCQLHIEWATPAEVKGEGQGRGNSGIFFQSRYEVQVLDSYENKTYFHGQAGSLYKQHPPLVNASRKPGEWQTYEIIFRAPRFNDDNTLKEPARVTVLHNGVVVQNHAEVLGKTVHKGEPKYEAHPMKQPLRLQDHGNPVRFRNVWLRPL